MDTAPQPAEAGMPYYAWGPNPSFFDAPSVPQRGITWTADTFLTASPDALMTRVVEPVCGFCWGYATLAEGGPEILPLTRADGGTWSAARGVLVERYPAREFRPGRNLQAGTDGKGP